MADKITSDNKIRADTASVNTAKVETDEAGEVRNMTGAGKAGSTNISGDKKVRPESKNVTKRYKKTEEGAEDEAEATVVSKFALTKAGLKLDGKDKRSEEGAEGGKKKKGKKLLRTKNKENLSRIEMQAKKSTEKTAIRRRMYANLLYLGEPMEDLDRDREDDEETSEKIVSKAEVYGAKIGNPFRKKTAKQKLPTRVKNAEPAEGKKKAPGTKASALSDGAEKVNARARAQAAEQIKKEQTKRAKEAKLKKEAHKRMIRKEYVKEVREKEKVKQVATKVSKKIQEMAAKHSATIVVIGFSLILFLICFVLLGSCALGVAALSGQISSGVFQSDPSDIENTELEFLYQEALLTYELKTMSTSYPDYDEYHITGDKIGHDAVMLIAYFSAKYGIFKYADVCAEVDELAELMYTVTYTESQKGPFTTYVPDGSGGYTLETYYIKVLTAEVSVTPLETLIMERLTDEQKVHYERLMGTRGGLQRFASPVEGWSDNITEGYGYQASAAGYYKNSGTLVHVASGSTVQAMCSGTVSAVGSGDYGNYVTITHESGYKATIAGITTVSVTVGSAVALKQSLGTTSGDVYFEISYDGVYYNPHFFVHY